MQSSYNYLMAAVIMISLMMHGCTANTSTPTALGISKHRKDVLQEANEYFASEQYKRAMLKYSAYIYSPNPAEKPHIEEARYRLALTHYLLEQHHEAYSIAEELLNKHPDSQWEEQAKELIEQSKSRVLSSRREQEIREQEIQQQIIQMENKLTSNQTDSDLYMDLADQYWTLGNHQQAVQYYEKAANMNPEHLQDSELKNRVRIAPDGAFTLRGPMMDVYTDDPVKIRQASLDKVFLADNWLGEVEGMRYSGVVDNTGLYDIANTQIQASIYDSHNTLLDTRTEYLGTIRAGERKPFQITFNLFHELHVNVSKVEAEVQYQTQ